MTKTKQMTGEPVMLSREQWVDVSAKLDRLAQYDDKLSAVMPSDYKDWHENSRSEWPEVAAHAITNLRKQRDQAENELEINRARVAELERENSRLSALTEQHIKEAHQEIIESQSFQLVEAAESQLKALREGLEGLIASWSSYPLIAGCPDTFAAGARDCADDLQSLLTQTTPTVNEE